jgi:hypothetical protein
VRNLVVVLVLALAAGTGCGDAANGNTSGSGTVAADRVDARVYAAVISWFAERQPSSDSAEVRLVFLDGLDDETIPIEVQVGVIEELEDDLEVRFIDALEEAVDEDAEGSPVRNGAFLLRLGPIVPREDHVEVDVESYEGADEVARYRVAVESSAESSRVVGEPEDLPVPDAPA